MKGLSPVGSIINENCPLLLWNTNVVEDNAAVYQYPKPIAIQGPLVICDRTVFGHFSPPQLLAPGRQDHEAGHHAEERTSKGCVEKWEQWRERLVIAVAGIAPVQHGYQQVAPALTSDGRAARLRGEREGPQCLVCVGLRSCGSGWRSGSSQGIAGRDTSSKDPRASRGGRSLRRRTSASSSPGASAEIRCPGHNMGSVRSLLTSSLDLLSSSTHLGP